MRKKGLTVYDSTRASASMAPLVHYRVPGRLAPLLVGPGAWHKGDMPNGALHLYNDAYYAMGAGGFGWHGGRYYQWHPIVF
jgi:hypothetical protein